jgi:heptosyltransferase-2
MEKIKEVNRILIIRTDRIGDVILNTPVFKALRHNFPKAHISVVIQPYVKEIIEGNPNIDEIITYDKNFSQASWWPTLRFIKYLRRKKFDLSIALNPSRRSNLVTFLAGIKYRVGYDRRWGFLLTHRMKDNKWMGLKHEVDYNLDLLRYVGLEVKDRQLYMPVFKEDEDYIADLLRKTGVSNQDILITVHPSASDHTKRWSLEQYARLIDKLIGDFKFKIALVSAKEDRALIDKLVSLTFNKPINFCGQTTLRQLAALCKKSQVFISNDSGPVHIAAAVKVPTIVIFGRTLAGVGPKRWGPYGVESAVVQKDVGCKSCNPQDCSENFKCLSAVSVEDVIEAIKKIIKINAL